MTCTYRVNYSNGMAWLCDALATVRIGSRRQHCGHRSEHALCDEHYRELCEENIWRCKICRGAPDISEPVAL